MLRGKPIFGSRVAGADTRPAPAITPAAVTTAELDVSVIHVRGTVTVIRMQPGVIDRQAQDSPVPVSYAAKFAAHGRQIIPVCQVNKTRYCEKG